MAVATSAAERLKAQLSFEQRKAIDEGRIAEVAESVRSSRQRLDRLLLVCAVGIVIVVAAQFFLFGEVGIGLLIGVVLLPAAAFYVRRQSAQIRVQLDEVEREAGGNAV